MFQYLNLQTSSNCFWKLYWY